MKIGKTIRNIAGSALVAGLASGVFAGTNDVAYTNAPVAKAQAPLTTRVRFENEARPGWEYSKETLEAGMGNTMSRTYIYDGDKGKYTATSLNNWDLGSVYATFGDKRGVGVEPDLVLGNWHLIGTFERDLKNNQDRRGAEVNRTIGNTTLGVAYDNVAGRESKIANIIVRDLPNIYGGALKQGDDCDSALAFYGHFGPKEAWGTRTWVKYDDVHATDAKVFTFDSIFAQNPTFFEIPHISSYTFLVSRNSIEGGLLGKTLVENPNSTERQPLNSRAKHGFVSEVSGAATTLDNGKLAGNARLDAGYTFDPIVGVKPGFEVFYNRGLTPAHLDTKGASVLLTTSGNPKVCLEGTVMDTQSGKDVYISAGVAGTW